MTRSSLAICTLLCINLGCQLPDAPPPGPPPSPPPPPPPAAYRAPTGPGLRCALGSALDAGSDSLSLPLLPALAGVLDPQADSLPAAIELTVVELTLPRQGEASLAVAAVPWRGLQLAPLDTAAPDDPRELGMTLYTYQGGVYCELSGAGSERQGDDPLLALRALLLEGPLGVALQVEPEVSAGFVLSLLAELVALGVGPRLALLDLSFRDPPGACHDAWLDQQLAPVVAQAGSDAQGRPAVGVRLRADARLPWSRVMQLLNACLRHQVSHVTFAALHEDIELDLFTLQGVEAPIRMAHVCRETGVPAAAADPPLYSRRAQRASLEPHGGSAASQAAVEAALDWLDRHQRKPRGDWGAASFSEQCGEGSCQGPSYNEQGDFGPGQGAEHYDVGVTALALLAFLGHGQTHTRGEHQECVRFGLASLLDNQNSDGVIGFDDMMGETIYNHALATIALSEAYQLSGDARLEDPARRAVEFCIEAQNPDMGWKYGILSGRNDTSVSGWMVAALNAGKSAGFEVPEAAFSGARNWFDRATADSGEVGYESPGGGSSYMPLLDDKLGDAMYVQLPTMTAVALLARLSAGEPATLPEIKNGARWLLENLPAWQPGGDLRQVNFYYWYHASYALFLRGGADWQTWNTALQAALLPTQRRVEDLEGKYPDAAGSWDPLGEWAYVGGRVYATAINALSLESYYRFPRQEP